MYDIKSQVYLSLTKVQKAALTRYLNSLAKKFAEKLTLDELYNKFIEDEVYYYEVGNPHFEWAYQLLGDNAFIEDTKLYLRQCLKILELKKAQKPLVEKQKAYLKQQRKHAQEIKMSREKPTQRQLYYYEKLCKKHNLMPVDSESLSKLDLKKMINDIIEECSEKNSLNT